MAGNTLLVSKANAAGNARTSTETAFQRSDDDPYRLPSKWVSDV